MSATLVPPRPSSMTPRTAPPQRKPLPRWLRTPPKRPVKKRPQATAGPRDIRWWVGVVWFVVAALLLGFVSHVVIVGALQHERSQHLLYERLRADLAEAISPLGQLDVDQQLVPNGTPIALIEIPSIGLSEVVVQGTTPTDLRSGPGHRRDTVYPGQEGTSVLYGRQTTYGAPFGALSTLAPGDEITVTTGQGEHRFEVFGIRRDGDLLPEALGDGEGRLELVTADGLPLAPAGTLHIDAALLSDVQETPSPVFTEEVLDPSESALAPDPGAWFPAFFWFQWLVAAAIALRWARGRWGVWQTWIVGVPLLFALGAATADSAIATFANLL